MTNSIPPLFSRAETIDCGSIEMVPVSAKVPMSEARMLQLLLEHNQDIVTVFPTLREASKNFEEAGFVMAKFAFGYQSHQRFSMFIKLKRDQDSPTIGMIWIDSPESSLGLETYWTLDFFIVKELRNQGVMSMCVDNLLKYCQFSGLNKIRAIVTDGNKASIRILKKSGFIHNSEVSSSKVDVFDMQL